MGPCHFNGNADLYGLGIRLGYYFQWYGRLLAPWVCPSEVGQMRLANSFFIASTLFALLIRGSRTQEVEVVEIYITLLFTFGSYLYMLPILLWRILTRCDPRYDPSRYPKSRSASTPFIHFQNMLLVVALSFQVSFWTKTTLQLKDNDCEQYGVLFFTKVSLDSVAFKALNLVTTSVLLALILGFLFVTPWARTVAEMLRIRGDSVRSRGPIYPSKRTILAYQVFDSAMKIFFALMMTIATELCIFWNDIQDVNHVNSIGQIIPLTIGVGSVVRMLYIALREEIVGKHSSMDHRLLVALQHLPGAPTSKNASHDLSLSIQGSDAETRHSQTSATSTELECGGLNKSQSEQTHAPRHSHDICSQGRVDPQSSRKGPDGNPQVRAGGSQTPQMLDKEEQHISGHEPQNHHELHPNDQQTSPLHFAQPVPRRVPEDWRPQNLDSQSRDPEVGEFSYSSSQTQISNPYDPPVRTSWRASPLPQGVMGAQEYPPTRAQTRNAPWMDQPFSQHGASESCGYETGQDYQSRDNECDCGMLASWNSAAYGQNTQARQHSSRCRSQNQSQSVARNRENSTYGRWDELPHVQVRIRVPDR